MTVSRSAAVAKVRERLVEQGALAELAALDTLGPHELGMLADWENFPADFWATRIPDLPPEEDRAGGGPTKPRPRPVTPAKEA